VKVRTVFERIWDQPDGHIFKSAQFGVMAVADAFAKFPYQVVVAPKNGSAGEAVCFSDLPRYTKRTLHEVADAVEEKIAAQCGDAERVITHTEGFGVPDHAHIVLFGAERRQGEALYTGSLSDKLQFSIRLKSLRLHQLSTSFWKHGSKRSDRPPNPTIPTTFTEMSEYIPSKT
jgi:hypothetical protein